VTASFFAILYRQTSISGEQAIMNEIGQPHFALACDLTAIPAGDRERHAAVARQLLGAARERRELADGYAVRLPADLGTALLLAEFIARERLCCPFFDFTVQYPRGGGPLWLSITGPEGAKAVLSAELGLDVAG
jgi:hypothetical protein